MLKGIIFDMDGTLTMTNEFHCMSYNKLFQEFDRNITFEEYYREFIGKGAIAIIKEKLAGIEYDMNECLRKKVLYFWDLIENEKEVPLVEGIVDFIEYCNQQGYQMTVASGASLESMNRVLKRTGLDQYFKQWFSGHDTKANKPAPYVYVKALNFLKLSADQTIAFEDSIAGIKSAKSAGIKCVALKTSTMEEKIIEEGVSALISNYEELLERLNKNQNYLKNILINQS
ncbi:HAD-IA family hydrolase [Candidatus Peregrinibacteria bacterium]|nr:HAD-IA family hydrolase [Candidatus Peregrinibacteria bacterium]